MNGKILILSQIQWEKNVSQNGKTKICGNEKGVATKNVTKLGGDIELDGKIE